MASHLAMTWQPRGSDVAVTGLTPGIDVACCKNDLQYCCSKDLNIGQRRAMLNLNHLDRAPLDVGISFKYIFEVYILAPIQSSG